MDFCFVCIHYAHYGGQFQLPKIVQSFLLGSLWMTSTYMGFHFLWFLPTMLMVIVIRDVYFNVSQSVKMLIVLIAFCFWLLESLDISLGYLNYIPFYFIYDVLLRITLCFLNPSILLGVSLLILPIVFSLMVAIVINHYPRIMNVLFPQ